MGCSFSNSANFVVPETQNILAQCPKVRKVLFLPEFRPLECSTGRVECLTDEPWVFLQIRFSSEQPSKDIRLYLPPNKVLPKKVPLVTWILFLTPLLKTSATNPEFLHSKAEKNVKHIFLEKNPFVSKFFSAEHMECGVKTPLKTFRQQNISFSLIAHKSNSFGYCQIFSPEMLRSVGHVEILPGSTSFFWSFCGRECCGLDTTGGFFF